MESIYIYILNCVIYSPFVFGAGVAVDNSDDDDGANRSSQKKQYQIVIIIIIIVYFGTKYI